MKSKELREILGKEFLADYAKALVAIRLYIEKKKAEGKQKVLP